ncbi:MAG TPA: cytochrome c oxidase assembly protein [Mycobacteriales bacterium]
MVAPSLPPAAHRRGRALATGVALVVIVGVAALVARGITDQSGPVLPLALCRAGQSLDFLAPLDLRRAFTAWQGDAVFDLVSVLAVLAYAWGARAYRRGTGARWPWQRSALFGVGIVLLVLATNSALAVYDMTLFSVHMIQHLALIMVIPAFLVLGRPLTMLLALSERARTVAQARVWAAVFSAPVALGAYAAVLVGTHLTGVMGQVMQHAWAGQLEHALYLVVGVQFFAAAIGNAPVPWRLSYPGRIFLTMAAMAVDTFVGIVLMMSVQPIAMLGHPGWGPSPLADTHLGGAVMWVGGDGLMALAPVALIVAWARSAEEPAEASGWFERARVAQLVSHGAAEPAADGAVDGDDAQLEAYNRWLAQLNRRS